MTAQWAQTFKLDTNGNAIELALTSSCQTSRIGDADVSRWAASRRAGVLNGSERRDIFFMTPLHAS